MGRTTGKERRISRWEHKAVLETVQARLDRNPDKMRAPPVSGASLRHDNVVDGIDALPDENARASEPKWRYTSGLQHETGDAHILGVGGLMEAIRA
jgi:hypothetical protein